MYKVFVNERPLILTNILEKEEGYKVYLLDSAPIAELVSKLNKGLLDEVHLYHPNKNVLLKKFTKYFPIVVAAGGVVKNNKGETLFIYRNGKWDLPKGKRDKGEAIQKAAIREVEEETGVSNLVITSFLRTTYHLFKRNGVQKLKETHWYEMHTTYNGELSGQLEEGITEVAWKKNGEIAKALKKSYRNIELFF